MVKLKVYADRQRGLQRPSAVELCRNRGGSAQQQIQLRPGLVLTLYSDDLDDQGQLDELLVEGVVSFSEEEHCWVAAIDWPAIRHASDGQIAPANGNNQSSPSVSRETGRTEPCT